MFGKLVKAAVGLVVETPVAIVADVVTMGGAMNDRREPYTASALKKVVENVQAATEDEREG